MTYKMIYLARRAKTVSREDWPRTWKSHAVFASQFPVLEAEIAWLRYCNRIDAPEVPGLSTAHDGVAVCASDSLESLNATSFTPDEREQINRDELRVFDMLTPNFSYFCEEQVVREGKLGEVAVFTFLARKPGTSQADFKTHWNGAHTAIAGEAVAALGTATRYALNSPVHDPLPLFPFDGIAEAWFAGADDAVRAFQGGELTPLRQDLAQFCDLDASVAMLTGVCHRWPKG